MRILIIGGTVFLGRHLTEAALARGHEVTLFNRGQRNPELFPEATKLRGDRDGGLDALLDGGWDAVIDTCGYVPRIVAQSVEVLRERAPHYTFISTISVYGDMSQVGMDESAAVGKLPDPSVEEITGETYGPLKALCENVVRESYGEDRSLIIRPGLIVGPHDPTDRFTYWPVRVARGGEILAPGSPEQSIQWIDARDLAEWILHMVEGRQAGTYNATGPAHRLTLRAFLEEAIAAVDTGASSMSPTGSSDGTTGAAGRDAEATLSWVEEDFLLEHKVGPWIEMPLWIPEHGPSSMPGLHTVRCDRALAKGLTFRPIANTVKDTLRWDQGRDPSSIERRAGMKAEREAEILEAWRSRG